MTKNQPVVSLMLRLQNMGCRIWAEDDKLRIRTSKNALTAELKQEIQNNKADILTFLKSAKTQAVITEEIPALSADSPKVLSFAQQRLWLLAQLQGSSATYNMPIALQLNGNLNIDALHSSLAYLLNRHESLRMYFPTIAGQPQIAIRKLDEIEVLTVQDCRNFDAHPESPSIQDLIDAHTQETFDLNTGPLFKAKLLQLPDHTCVLAINMHHIISDGWSMGVFVRELRQAYTAFSQGQTPNLAPLPIQYSDYAAWQRNWLQGEVLENQINYWKHQLQDASPLLELPTDYPRPAEQSYRGDRYLYSLTPELSTAVKAFSQQQGVSLYMTLLATLSILLSRYSRQNDLCIGSPIANRTHSQTESLIGFFVNTLVLRNQINPEQSFIELLQRTRQTCLDAYAHQDIPFEVMVEKLQPERSMSYNPLFQVMFALENNESPELGLPGLEIQWLGVKGAIAKFDLTLLVMEDDNQLSCSWEYATDLFDQGTIQRMAEHFEVLLKGIIDHPQQPIHTLPLMTAAELLQLQRWNQTQTDYPHDKTLVDLFEQQVTKNPNHLALVFQSKSLTYQQLNQKANQLANYLIQNHQIQPDTLIGICVERSLEMIIGVLGILKAGGAYVPIDPNYPQERIQFMLENAGTSVLLTQTFLKEKLPLTALKNQVICLDEEAFSEELTDNPSPQNTPDNLAYVIYTSGSTGQPKGVMIEHRAIVNLALAWTEIFQVQRHSRWIQFGSFSFDLSIGEIATTLSAGACLYLAKKETLLPSQALVDLLAEHKISHFALSPSALSVLPQAALPDLKAVMVGGEACAAELVTQWGKTRSFFNCYGPTESTVIASISSCETNGKKPSIGQPIANNSIYILDAQNQPLPPGIPGELCIAGVGLARGYLNRPETTAEKFIEIDLFGKIERIYKTGDLARWNYNGNLEYLGRIDAQVKLRGFRIELGEIESLLLQHTLIKEAVVILSEADSNPRLIAYVIAENKSLILGIEVKEYLKNRLPNYMIPSQIMVLEQLPLTPNGKLDYRALPVPETDTSTDMEMPVTPTEELLASLWQGLLKVKSVSRSDNFFELGGHSLLATQLVTRIRDSFGVELPVRKVFEQSILSELAREIDGRGARSCAPPIAPQPENQPKTLSFAQSRLWFIAQLEGKGTSATYNMPIALQLQGKLNIEALRQSLTYLLQRHTSLRSYFPALEGEPQVVVRNVEDIEVLAIANLQELDSQTQAETVQKLADTHAQELFDLNTGPLFRAKLLQLSSQKNVLLINMHHIISDGWSMGVFKREWEQAYAAYAAGSAPNLSPLPIQYSDYAAWQRNWLQGEILASQENYWQQQLGDAPRLLELPTDYPRPAQQSYQGEREEYCLSQELTQKLKNLSQQHGVSLFMTMLTAFNILLSRYSCQEDLCVGSPIANRTHSYTEGLIGFFVNTLVLRHKVKPEQVFIDLLQQTRQTCLDAYAHQDIPFELLVEQLQPERSLSYNPLFQVMMVLQNGTGAGTNVSLPGLDVQYLEQSFPFAKFDLLLDLRERDEKLHCMWEYATDLFTAATIRRMAGHWEVLLTAITENPQQPIYQLPIITPAEVQQLQIWNQTDIDYPQNLTLVTLFEQQVAKTPDQIAVVFANQSLSYQELNQKANQLAHHLLQLKSLSDHPLMAICMERSLEMLIGIFAILKAGGAYLPIDPSYPQERIYLMLEDSNADVLLTTKSLEKRLPLENLNNHAQVVFIDEQKIWNNQSTNDPNVASNFDDLAYVIYTSGSTGRPKGVAIAHSSPVALVKWAHSVFNAEQLTGVLASTSICFDLSIFEIFVPLTQGGSVILVENALYIEQASQSPVPITLINTVPSAAAELLKMKAIPASVQVINLAGEPLKNSLVQALYQTTSVREIYNLYGPSEDTTYSTFTKVAKNAHHEPSIGKAIANTRIYILDNYNQPLPPGIPGEICIAGAGLAKSYLHRPDLTAKKFIEVNLCGKTERIYKTGDLARWLPDGNLQYLGRIDHQVKLRGFRIELGEIEASLLKHPKIQEAVVLVKEEADFDQRLVAYVVPTADQTSQNEQVELWEQVFNNSYSQKLTPSDDPTLNIAGWKDSYTGKLIPSLAMQEWRDTTVNQILELAPKRVWEIGCGTGMLLFKVAPHCQHYLGTDVSLGGLQYIEQHLKQQSLYNKVTLKHCAANQFGNIETNAYDLVIINSVIQYFPSWDYLLSVIAGVIETVSYQGKILVGDVRNFQLLEAFHTAVEFHRASDDLSIQELRQQIQKSIRTEEELLIDPDFFIALKQRFPRISHVQIQLKPGYSHTEMSRFRYDVVLHLDRSDTPLTQPEWLDWQDQQLNLETIKQILTSEQPDLLGIKDIPNARLTSEMALLEQIPQLDGTITDLKAAIAQIKSGIEPEALRTLARDLPYTPFIQYSSTKLSDYDVVFQRNIPGQETLPRFATKANWRLKPWQHYANQPLQYRTNQVDPALLAEWRDFLGKTLPDYMIPSHFTVLEKLPLTPNGKVDRKALPATNTTFAATEIELPVTETEKSLAELWAKLLKYEVIARQDNFFHLGGHSLLATQLCYRIRDKFKVELPLAKVFEFPNLSELANYLDTCIWVNSTDESMQPLTSDEEEIEL